MLLHTLLHTFIQLNTGETDNYMKIYITMKYTLKIPDLTNCYHKNKLFLSHKFKQKLPKNLFIFKKSKARICLFQICDFKIYMVTKMGNNNNLH